MGRDYYVGVDIGQKHDHSVVIAVEKIPPAEIHVVHKLRFPLGTEYSAVIGHLHELQDNLHDVQEILIDQTGVGEVFVEEARKSGLKNVRGLVLTVQSKQEVMVFLKKVVEEQRLHIPFDRDLINEITAERFELMKSGLLQYSHPSNTHDDLFWALGLAIYAARPDRPVYHPIAQTGYGPYAPYSVRRERWLQKIIEQSGKPNPPAQRMCISCGKHFAESMVVCPNCKSGNDPNWRPTGLGRKPLY